MITVFVFVKNMHKLHYQNQKVGKKYDKKPPPPVTPLPSVRPNNNPVNHVSPATGNYHSEYTATPTFTLGTGLRLLNTICR